MGAPEYILIAAIVIGVAWYFAGRRGRLTVRAFAYLSELEVGGTPEAANQFAASIDSTAAAKVANVTMDHVRQFYGGRQLELISHARLKGFKG